MIRLLTYGKHSLTHSHEHEHEDHLAAYLQSTNKCVRLAPNARMFMEWQCLLLNVYTFRGNGTW